MQKNAVFLYYHAINKIYMTNKQKNKIEKSYQNLFDNLISNCYIIPRQFPPERIHT